MIIRYFHPKVALAFDGERFTSDTVGAIESEHIHRYLFALQFCENKVVLDVASGEGYGSALLSQIASRVVGVDIDPVAVRHAQRSYPAQNLTFDTGNCLALPLEDASVDVVVSFETLEHVEDHDGFFCEVRRVLREDGIFIVSTPDTNVYSNNGNYINPFHMKELSRKEFRDAISSSFSHHEFFEQKAVFGSAIRPLAARRTGQKENIFSRVSKDQIQSDLNLFKAPYLIAVASAKGLPAAKSGLYEDASLLQRYTQKIIADRLVPLTGWGKTSTAVVFSLRDRKVVPDGATALEWHDHNLTVIAADFDPRLILQLPEPENWLILSMEFVATREGTGQIFTQTILESRVDVRTAQAFSVVSGVNRHMILLSRDAPITLVRLDPFDYPGKGLMTHLELIAPAHSEPGNIAPTKTLTGTKEQDGQGEEPFLLSNQTIGQSRISDLQTEETTETGVAFQNSPVLRDPAAFGRFVRDKGHADVQGWVTHGALATISVLSALQQTLGIGGHICEIGVHHGRFMIALSLLRGDGEKSLAIDVFEDQDLNVDNSGKGDSGIFLRNVAKWLGANPDVLTMKADSLSVSGKDVTSKLGGSVRIFSVDGSHTCEHTLNDLKIAEESICEGGLVIVDDFFNLDWPEVAEALVRYLSGPSKGRKLEAVGYGDNKFYLTTTEYVETYQKFLETTFRPHLVALKKVSWCGKKLLRIASQGAEKVFAQPLVAPGRKHSFSSQTEAPVMYLGGWGKPERAGIWATTASSGIAFGVAKEALQKLSSISVELSSFRHPRNSQPVVDVYLFDRNVATVEFALGKDLQALEIPVDRSMLGDDGRVELWFHNQSVSSPFELGMSADTRNLSVLVHSLTVR